MSSGTTEPMRIVVSLPDQENEFQLLQAADARETAQRLGLEIEILNAEGSPVLQVQQLFRAIHAEPRPAAIVVEPHTVGGMENMARKTVAAGVGLAVLNCTLDCLDSIREQTPNVPVFSVSSDQVEIGRVQGRQLKVLLPAGGSVLYIHGPHGSVAARERFAGVSEVLEQSSIQLTVLDSHQWSDSSAEQTVRSWLRLKSSERLVIDVIAAQDDSMARGARRAVETTPEVATRWKSLRTLGIDGVPEVGQRFVNEGQLTATVIMPSNTGAALEVLSRWHRAGATQPVASLSLVARSFPNENDLRRHAIVRQELA